MRASAAEFVLEGLWAHRRISRTEAFEFSAGERQRDRNPAREVAEEEEDARFKKSRRQYQ